MKAVMFMKNEYLKPLWVLRFFLKEARIPPLTKEKWPSAVYPVAGITADYRVENRVFIIKITRIKISELLIRKFDPVMKPYPDQNC